MNTAAKNIEKRLSVSWIYLFGKILLVIALSRTKIIETYPFGIAFSAVFAEENAIAAIAALVFGMLWAGKWTAAKYISAILIYVAAVRFRKLKNLQVKAVALGAALIVSAAVTAMKAGASVAEFILIVPETFAVGGLFYLFSSEKKDGMTEYAKGILLVGACLGGFYGIKIPYIAADFAILAGVLAIMCVSYSCDAAIAALTGAVLGIMILTENPESIATAGIFALSAASASVVAKMGKAGVSTGFLSGVTVCVLCMGRLGALSIADIFAAPIIFLLLPENLLMRIEDMLNGIFITDGIENEMVAEKLKTVARAVGDLGNGVKILSENAVKENDLYEAVCERVCKGCRNYAYCVEEDAAAAMTELKEVIERDGFLNFSNAPQRFGNLCIRSENLMREFSHLYELYKQNEVHKGEAAYDRNIVINQYDEISNIIDSLSQSVSDSREKTENFEVSVAVCQEPRGEQEINGDTVIHFKKGSRYFVILCDGMGSGKAAREISSLSARLFSEFLNSGISKQAAVKMINSALALNVDRESFSSADILEIDLVTGEAEFMKIGSAQSFVKSGNTVGEISSSALPIGILESIEVMPQKVSLLQNDMILMISDGIGEASSGIMKNEWIKKLLLSGESSDEALARRFLESAKSRTVYSDDMTCVIVRLKKA